jgi:hypothetical protein
VTEPWHDECRRLRAEGLTQPDIAARLEKSREAVRMALDESEEQNKTFRRARESTYRRKPRPRSIWAERGMSKIQPEGRKSPLPPLETITLEIKREAILAYAHGDIDRHEMMRRITPVRL